MKLASRSWSPHPATSGTNQIDDTLWLRLVLGSLGEEKKPLAGLSGMSGVGTSNVGSLLATKVIGQVLVLDRLIAEPEELLGVYEASKHRVNGAGEQEEEELRT